MKLDEAIKHREEVAEDRAGCCEDCAEEHRQLAEWLRELKHLRNLIAYAVDFDCKIDKAEKMLRVAEHTVKQIEEWNKLKSEVEE
mgnify:CR=1 FL=1